MSCSCTVVPLIAALLFSTPITAQQVPERTLEIAATHSEPLSRIRGIRELSDGSVLIADQTEKALYLMDFESDTRTQLGRQGSGPREFMTPIGLSWYPGDSTLMRDLENRRYAVIDQRGMIGQTFPSVQFDHFIGSAYVSRDGSIYFSSSISVGGSRANHVFRWNREAGTLDTLALLASSKTFTDDGREWPVPWSTPETWALMPDGRVVLVRKDPYRIEILHSDGRVTSREVDYEPIRVTRADRAAWNERPQVSVASVGGTRPTLPDNWDFPEHFDPFVYSAASVTEDGRIWVERRQSMSARQALFDVFDSDGNLIERVRLPEGVAPVGFGDGVVYGRVVDEVELKYLVRMDY